MSCYKVLVDSSVWVEYFKSGGMPKLDRLIEEDLACINEIIFTELSPVLMKQKKHDVLRGLEAIEKVPLIIDWDMDIVRQYQLMNLNQCGHPRLD